LTLCFNTLLEVFDSYFNSIAEVFCLISDRPFIVLSPYSLITGLMVCWSLVNILSPYFLVSILKVLRILPLYLHNTQSVVLCPAPSASGCGPRTSPSPTASRKYKALNPLKFVADSSGTLAFVAYSESVTTSKFELEHHSKGMFRWSFSASHSCLWPGVLLSSSWRHRSLFDARYSNYAGEFD
jgi:hypothetical protein